MPLFVCVGACDCPHPKIYNALERKLLVKDPNPIRGWSVCEIMYQAGAGLYKPGQQQRLLFHVEAEQDDYIKEICSPEGLVFNPARL